MVGKLDHVIMMSIVSAIGRVYKQVLVFQGRDLHYQAVNNDN